MTEKPIEAEAEEVHPDDGPDPEEHQPSEVPDDRVSDSTGTAYAATGEPETTPHDELPEDVEE